MAIGHGLEFVEMPWRDRKRFDRKWIFSGAAIGIVFFVAAGTGIELGKGFPARFGADQALADSQSDFSPMRDTCGNQMPGTFDGFCIIGSAGPSSPIYAYLGDSHGKELFWKLAEHVRQDQSASYRVQPFL